ncbi:MAG: hypothetical protein L3K04_01030 [Thermoplasmata archaeon]|nr:hypothetical protein [Thermoplasmata archaeon]MCI4340800.1 hypothetical protein [Thermoplasmata archaeon]
MLHDIEEHLRTREERRDQLADRSRRLRRRSQVAMTALHAGTTPPPALAEIRQECAALAIAARRAPSEPGVVLDGLQEATEAILLSAVLAGTELPGPTEVGVEPEVYLLGLGDLAGEVRRLALRSLARGEVDAADRYLRFLDELVLTLLRFDAPRSIVSLKPKQDAARGIVERTRGDVTLARMLARVAGAPRRKAGS